MKNIDVLLWVKHVLYGVCIFVISAMGFWGCSSSLMKIPQSDNIGELIAWHKRNNLDTIYLESKTYVLDGEVRLPRNTHIIGDNTIIEVRPVSHVLSNMFNVTGDDVSIHNILFRSSNRFPFIADPKSKSSNWRAIVAQNKFRIKNLKVENCEFENLANATKLIAVDGLILKGLKGSGLMMGIYVQESKGLDFSQLSFNRETCLDRFSHHIYINSSSEIKISDSYFEGGAGKAINIKADDPKLPSGSATISNIELDNTNGFFFTYVDKISINDVRSLNTSSLVICSREVNSIEMRNVFAEMRNYKGELISALDKSNPVIKFSVDSLHTVGPLRIYPSNIVSFTLKNSRFEEFLENDTPWSQNPIYLKQGRYSGDITIENCEFIQTKEHTQNNLIRNENCKNLKFVNNNVLIKSQKILRMLNQELNSFSVIENNNIEGVLNLQAPNLNTTIKQNKNKLNK